MSKKTEKKPRQIKELTVVGIGASAGGLDALQEFFKNLPDNTDLSFIIIQHLSPNFKSLMSELLSKFTKMKILKAENEVNIEPDTIYLNRNDKNLIIKNKKLLLIDKNITDKLNLPIDLFFHSLGNEYGENAIAVILSGTGSDGSRGIKTVKEAGGTIMVQDPNSAQFNGMPNTALHTHIAEFVGTPKQLAEKIIQITLRPKETLKFDENKDEKIFAEILNRIKVQTGIDFNKYKINTLSRRMKKRMDLSTNYTLKEYLNFIKTDENEIVSLYKEFLIGVTSFFRDPEAYEALKEKAFKEICRNKDNKTTIRVWVPGCSTGEEAYSLAILLDEYIRKNKLQFDYKIFATDIDKESLNRASTGAFPVNILADLIAERLQDYFIKSGDQFLIIKKIREKIIFSYHNVIKDPPFIRMDLISCRNLMIYLKPETQTKLLHSFQFSLNLNGILFLGTSENINHLEKYFETINSKWRIFKNIIKDKNILSQMTSSDVLRINSYPKNTLALNYDKDKLNSFFYQFLANNYSPACCFIDESFNILFSKGNINKFLKLKEGFFSSNLLEMLDVNISAIVKNGIRRLIKEQNPVMFNNVPYFTDDKKKLLNIKFFIASHDKPRDDIYLIEFNETEPDENQILVIEHDNKKGFVNERIKDLEAELKKANQEKQTIVEELETSNEELQSSNEELMASNEELQSTNEELQSVNEELYTVNSELQSKNQELEDITLDMENLLVSTEIGTLFLDVNFRIRKFTPELKKLFHLNDNDIGRPIHDFASNFINITSREILEDVKKVLETGTASFREVKSIDKLFYLKRTTPFRTSNKNITGVVITFIDITKLHLAEEQLIQKTDEISDQNEEITVQNEELKASYDELQKTNKQLSKKEKRFKDIFEQITIGIAHVSFKGEFLLTNKRFCEIFGYTLDEIKNVNYHDIINIYDEQKEKENLQKLNEGTIKSYNIEKKCISKDGSFIWINSTNTLSSITEKNEKYFISVIEDITDKKNIEKNFNDSEEKFKFAMEATEDGLWDWNITTNEVYFNPAWAKILELTPEELEYNYEFWEKRLHPDEKENILKNIDDHLNGKSKSFSIEHRLKTKNNEWKWVHERGKIIEYDGNNKPVRMIGTMTDISFRKKAEEKMYFHSRIMNQINDSVFSTDLNGIITSWNKGAENLHGFAADEIIGKSISNIINDPDENFFSENVTNILFKQDKLNFQLEMLSKSGKNFIAQLSISALKNEKNDIIGTVGNVLDITDRINYENQLNNTLEEKEILLQDIHHRVKNNMSLIISLLGLEKLKIIDDNDFEKEKVIISIDNIIARVNILAAIYNHLHQINSSFETTECNIFFTKLIDLIKKTVQTDKLINFDVQIEEIILPIKKIIPIGLIINEIISNIYKHIITDKPEIKILFSLKKENKNTYKLEIRDDGKGFDKDIKDKNTLGIQLIEVLIDQINGNLNIISNENQGGQYLITFKD